MRKANRTHRSHRNLHILFHFPKSPHSPLEVSSKPSPRPPASSPGFLLFPRPPPSRIPMKFEFFNCCLRAPGNKAAPPAQAGQAWGKGRGGGQGAGAWLPSARGASRAFEALGLGGTRAGAWRNTECMGISGGVRRPSAAPAPPPRRLWYRIWTVVL